MRPAVALLVLAAAGCAKIAPPPGGPPDLRAPRLLATRPDSLASLSGFEGDVEFRFDEVVSEGGQPNFGLGSGDLEKLVLLSPSEEVPVVRWRRDRITVHPRGGWLPNTVYRVELLSGVRDLRNNTSQSSAVVTFTTGGELPTDTLRGLVVDWTTSRPVRQALVEAVLQPDSLVYRTRADSSGRFRFGPLPRGEYVVYGVLDQNRNGRRESRENFDSVRIVAGRDSVGEVWAFRQDSVPPRIQNVSRSDSLTAILTFAAHLDPYQRIAPDSVRLLQLPDSTAVEVETVLPPQEHDSLYRPRPARDTTRPAADTTAAPRPAADTARPGIPGVPRQPPRVVGARQRPDTLDTGPLRTKPPLFDKLHLRVKQPWRDSTRYVVFVHGVRTVNGISGTARGLLEIAAPAPLPDSAAAAGDSLRARPDTTRRDSVRTDTAGAARNLPRLTRSVPARLRLSSLLIASHRLP